MALSSDIPLTVEEQQKITTGFVRSIEEAVIHVPTHALFLFKCCVQMICICMMGTDVCVRNSLRRDILLL